MANYLKLFIVCDGELVVQKDHDVRLDYVGLNPRPRFTCYSRECSGATLLRQPYMSFAEWEKATEEFSAKHPSSKIKNEGWRG